MLAVAGRIASVVDRRFREGGASTLATQIEKFRHSPGGRTPGVGEKLRQMLTASAHAYRDGPDTTAARREIVTTYLNSTPLGSRPGYGEVIGVPEALWIWFGTDFGGGRPGADHAGQDQGATGAQGRDLSASPRSAARRPPTRLLSERDRAALAALTDRYLRLLADAGIIDPALRDAALARQAAFPHAAAAAGSGLLRRKQGDGSPAGRAHDAAPPARSLRPRPARSDGLATVDTAAQKRVTDVLQRLGDPASVSRSGWSAIICSAEKIPGRSPGASCSTSAAPTAITCGSTPTA